MKRGLVISTLPELDEVGEDVLRKGGTALRAVLTSFFVAAGQRPGLALAPLALLVAGVGSGVRVYDGRCRQPGLLQKRPRGFQPGESIPSAAYAAVPTAFGALALACAYDSGTTILSCSRPGMHAARAAGAAGRAELLEQAGSHGGGALNQSALRRALLGQFGPAEGGNLSPADLSPPSQLDGAAASAGAVSGLPWDAELDPGAAGSESPALAAAAGSAHGIVAIDANGQFVALGLRELTSASLIDGFETTMPLLGEPVMRGVSRVAPGAVLPLDLALEVERDPGGALIAISAKRLGASGGRELRLGRDPATKAVARLDSQVIG
ncbi:MAG TPA: hypothetical protein VLC09_19680 [Polyangiaceae bacterium]|nr:hypothetical protein [Polyangiaceae bacterium]